MKNLKFISDFNQNGNYPSDSSGEKSSGISFVIPTDSARLPNPPEEIMKLLVKMFIIMQGPLILKLHGLIIDFTSKPILLLFLDCALCFR